MRGQGMITGNFAPGFRIDLHRKDLNIVMQGAREIGTPLLVASLVSQLMDAASVAGRGDQDHSALLTVLENLAGIAVKDATGA